MPVDLPHQEQVLFRGSPGTVVDAGAAHPQQRALAHQGQGRVLPVYHLPTFVRTHGPDLSAKKSRSTFNWPPGTKSIPGRFKPGGKPSPRGPSEEDRTPRKDRATKGYGSPSHISKMVLPTVHSGPPEQLLVSLARAPGPSLHSTQVLPNQCGPPHTSGFDRPAKPMPIPSDRYCDDGYTLL